MKRALLASALFVGIAGLAYAHHSFSATYQEGKEIKIEGTVTNFMIRNPHSFIHVDAKDEKGAVHNWAIEWAGPAQLGRKSVTRDTIKPGDFLVIIGEPSRNPDEYRARLVKITRPRDGWTFTGAYD